jgi:hypothetical protein
VAGQPAAFRLSATGTPAAEGDDDDDDDDDDAAGAAAELLLLLLAQADTVNASAVPMVAAAAILDRVLINCVSTMIQGR